MYIHLYIHTSIYVYIPLYIPQQADRGKTYPEHAPTPTCSRSIEEPSRSTLKSGFDAQGAGSLNCTVFVAKETRFVVSTFFEFDCWKERVHCVSGKKFMSGTKNRSSFYCGVGLDQISGSFLVRFFEMGLFTLQQKLQRTSKYPHYNTLQHITTHYAHRPQE